MRHAVFHIFGTLAESYRNVLLRSFAARGSERINTRITVIEVMTETGVFRELSRKPPEI